MRSLSLSALLAVAAFALGLAAGGRIPPAASAADAKPEEVGWKSDSRSLTLTNGSSGLGVLAIGKLGRGSKAPVPARATGQVVIPLADVNSLVVYRVQSALLCERNGCRPCQPPPVAQGDCPIPPPIPVGAGQYMVNVGPRGVPRP